jgi:Carbohydrate family 9 binding domain-like
MNFSLRVPSFSRCLRGSENFLFITLVSSTIFSCMNPNAKTYSVKKIQAPEIVIAGKGDDPQWATANELTDFIYPWEKETPPFTSFKALHSTDWLYCFYKVVDDNVQVLAKTNEKKEVIYSDRVEIFFRKDEKMLPYYGLELDPNGRVYDYEAEFHRKFNPNWTWPTGQLVVKASRTSDGYIVELAVSKKSLLELGLLKVNKIEAGIFRGECIEIIEGADSKIKWISWVKPDSVTPNFHIPSAFGELVLEE